MVLNQVEFLSYSDKIVILSEGKIAQHDTFQNLLKNETFLDFMKKFYPDFQTQNKHKQEQQSQKNRKEEEIKQVNIFQQETIISGSVGQDVFMMFIRNGCLPFWVKFI